MEQILTDKDLSLIEKAKRCTNIDTLQTYYDEADSSVARGIIHRRIMDRWHHEEYMADTL